MGENQNSTFKNYQQDTEDKTILFNHFLKFALAVQHQTNGNSPLGLFVSGKAGIGKTHLSNAVMNALVDKNILCVDEDYISQEFQAKAMMPDFKRWLHQIDLIILDDINTYYGSASTFFKASLEYIFKNNKCLLVTSNHPLNLLTDNLPRYINYIDPILNNLTVINEFNMMSFRTKWIDSIINLDNPLQRLIDQVGLAAVIIIDSPKTAVKYQKIIQQQTKKKVRIALDPYRNGVVFDLYMYDLYQYSYFIVEVFDKSQAEQLVNLVNHVHHNNKGCNYNRFH